MLPRTLKIRGRTWTVSHTKRPPKWVSRKRGELPLGYCDPARLAIWVQKTENNEEDLSTLAHEVDHAIHPEACERVIMEGEDGLYSFLRDNPLDCFRGQG